MIWNGIVVIVRIWTDEDLDRSRCPREGCSAGGDLRDGEQSDGQGPFLWDPTEQCGVMQNGKYAPDTEADHVGHLGSSMLKVVMRLHIR